MPLVLCWQSIETDMVEQVQRFDELNECGQQIVQYVDNEETVQKISSQLESFQERWEKLVRKMELQSKQVLNFIWIFLSFQFLCEFKKFPIFVSVCSFNFFLNTVLTHLV